SHNSFLDESEKQLPVVTLVKRHGQAILVNIENGESSPVDLAFPVLHGTNGEDGTIQGLFKLVGVPFVGCGVLSSALCMDKEIMKNTLSMAGIQNAKYKVIRKKQNSQSDLNYSFDELKSQLGLPFFIKPANAGSSVGVFKIKSKEDFAKNIYISLKYDTKVIAEEFVKGRELEISVMGLNESPRSAVPGEVVCHHDFYSYEAKYLDPQGADILIPAQLSNEISKEMKKIAEHAYIVCGCNGLARVDFFLTEKNELYVNELNTLPGFTAISMFPKMWEAAGVKYQTLINELIAFALERHKIDSQLVTNFF
ncbi:MAG TPA: D-alanine--D-alanine ligase family protein, partial [Pseudobdellovibrionaceae bacterium]|nr:D-alanine--D-alanine ligase family protein [Pseudobdellovibrionaceae bacterium]